MNRRSPCRKASTSRLNQSSPSHPDRDPRLLLLAQGLTFQVVERLLKAYGIADAARADGNLQAMAGDPQSRQLLADLLAELLAAVAKTADPDQALDQWERFLQNGASRLTLFSYLKQSPRMLNLLCQIFGNCPALTQTLVRDPTLVYWLAEQQVLRKRPSRRELERSLQGMLRNVQTLESKLEALRRFRRREMLRIGVRDLIRLADVDETTRALSDLAGVLIQAAYTVTYEDLQRRYGVPMHRTAAGAVVETGFAVIALGKLGGQELNYSSDVDVIYVYDSDEGAAAPAGTGSLTNEEFFEVLARELTRALADVTPEGYVYRVDLRLRAEGTVGRLARSLSAYRQYYQTRGQKWERLALLKAWPVAGDVNVGKAFLRHVESFVFGDVPGAVDNGLFQEVRSIKEMIDSKIFQRGETHRNVKLGTGGIREIEFIVQAFQVLHGWRLKSIRERNTLAALSRLRRQRLLTTEESRQLAAAYRFLRDVEHKLQMVHDLQTHALPGTLQEVGQCAVRLGYAARNRTGAARLLIADHRRHTGNVNRIFRRCFYAARPPRLGRAGSGGRKARSKH
jgi:glutamate-ammonia-ligase adenylyltransferase